MKQGVKDTHALGALFRGLVGNPERTYLIGHSMGGHITGVAIEQYPKAYAGAMPMCGVMGDVELFDYFLDYNLLAQALADWPAEFPPPSDYQTDGRAGCQGCASGVVPDRTERRGRKVEDGNGVADGR